MNLPARAEVITAVEVITAEAAVTITAEVAAANHVVTPAEGVAGN